MKLMVLKVGLLLIVVALIVVVALALSRGRDSRYFHLLSTVFFPLSKQFVSPQQPLPTRPFVWLPDAAPLDWQWFQPLLVDVGQRGDGLILTPTVESLWWKNQRGPMLYTTLEGDATISVSVQVRKRTDPALPPDMEWQFGGIILRDPGGDALLSRENYVFNVIGHRGKSLQLETKSTRNGDSQVDAWNWESGDAELRIERKGDQFLMLARENATSPWREFARYQRPDLPARLQAGLIVYAFSEGRGKFDMQARFDAITID